MSISKAQAEALAENFLDGLGSDKEGLQPRETFSEIILIAGELIEDAQENLNKSNSIASGALSASLEASEPIMSNGVLSVDIKMLFYGLFINSGVKGTKKGSGLYAFKHDRPPEEMVRSIRNWIAQGKAKSINTNAKKTTSAQEKKNTSIAEIDNAYAVARSILQKGIKRTGFLDKAADAATKKASDRLGAALKIDILDSI